MSRVIKSIYESPASESAPLVLNPSDILRKMRGEDDESLDTVSKAERRAHEIIQEANIQAEEIRNQAYEEGYRSGITQSSGVMNQLVARLEADIATVAQERQGMLDAIEADSLKLCVEIAEKVIRHEVRTDPQVILRTLRSCLRRITDRDEVYVRVSPKEVAEVRAQRDELLLVSEGVRGINIVDDRRVSPGGCIIESPSGDLDARIETQVDQLNRKITEVYTNERRDQSA